MASVTSTYNLQDGTRILDIEWWIADFAKSIKNGKVIYSEPFPSESKEKFRLRAEIVGFNPYLLHLHFCIWQSDFRIANEPVPETVDVRIPESKYLEVLDSYIALNMKSGMCTQLFNEIVPNTLYLIKSCSFAESDDLLKANSLHIKLTLKYPEICGDGNRALQNLSLCDFMDLCDDKFFTDITVEAAGGVKRRAHKVVLVARSRVFYAMFKHTMFESSMSTWKVHDIHEDVLNIFLRFLYTGVLPNGLQVKDCKILLSLADKYDIGPLRELTQDMLYKQLSINNAIEILLHASIHRADFLKQLTMTYIQESGMEKVIKTENWKNLNLHSDVSTYMLEFIFQ